MAEKYTAAVITVSDKGAAGAREDLSGPAVAGALRDAGFDVVYSSIVPDEREDIKRELVKCSDELGIALTVTTGGTGFAPRDITPEATLEVIERHVPGIPEAMRQASLKATGRAVLSRSQAGIRRASLIINLPGSPKAALENLAAVSGALAHGLDMLRAPAADHPPGV
jgi:molybdenum cofactor synthesis domain-containing protein